MAGAKIVNLSKDVFERRTSTGSVFFSFLDSGFAHFLGQLVSIIVKTLRNTNLGASRCFKMKKTSLPVDVRRSKTPLLKLPRRGRGEGEKRERASKKPEHRYLEISRGQFGADSSIIFKFIALLVEARGDGPFSL